MKTMDVTGKNIDLRFTTNDSGNYFFVITDGASKQIDSDSGYNNSQRMKRRIREYLQYKHDVSGFEKLPRLTYKYNW